MVAQSARLNDLQAYLADISEPRLSQAAQEFLFKAKQALATGEAFGPRLALASRHAKRRPLELTPEEDEQAQKLLPGWTPVAWNQLELLRIQLLLARPDLEESGFADDFEALFRFADEGETCALYRSLPLLPGPERFVWRAAEACRTNMSSVFQALALDSPYPVQYFDDTAWQQLVIKALFLDQPLHRIAGLDGRLTPELTRMALDWAQERASAGRHYYLGLWLCLGPHRGKRVEALLREHWSQAGRLEREAMLLAAARAGQRQWLAELEAQGLEEPLKHRLHQVAGGRYGQSEFADLFGRAPG